MSKVLPLDSRFNDYSFETVLDGIAYRFRLRWNERSGRWWMDTLTSAGIPIVAGIPLVIRNDLIGRHATTNRPAGVLMAIDLDETGEEAGRADLGERVLLVYTPADEVRDILVQA